VRALVAVVVLAFALPAVVPAAAPPPVRASTLPRAAVVGAAWQAVLRAAKAPTLVAVGPATLRAKARGARGVFRATLRFPRAGSWQISAVLGGKTTKLGTVRVDVARDPLLTNPFTIATDPSGALLVGQMDKGPLVRIVNGRAATVADGVGVFHVATSGGATYVAGADGAVHRVDGSSFVRVTPALEAGAVAVDAAGSFYVTVYAGWVKKVTPAGAVTTIAGTGTEGYSGDNGPATKAQLFHPHSLALGRDGALYVADTENRRIRRIDLQTGLITTFGGDVGITVSIAVAADGTVYSADVVRDGTGGGITRTTPQGVTTRLASSRTANGVAVGTDGSVYVNLWEDKRIDRLDPQSGALEPIARG
jgi:sugar lactone lactonase YvrE